MHSISRLPITDPVVIFALAMLIFLSVPLLFQRLRVPGMIGLIVAGAAVGPNGLGLLERDETVVLLGTVGLLYLMFMAGVEIDLQGFRRHRARSLEFGAVSFLLPQVAGTGVGLVLGFPLATSILLGSVLSSHTLLAYPLASGLGIAKNEAVTATVGGTIVTDIAALLVLAVVAASREGELDAAFWTGLTLSLAVFAALILLGLPRLGRWFFRSEEDGETGSYLFILAALFTSAALAELAGVEPIIGSFLAGLALNPLVPEGSPLNNRVHFFGNAVFVPFFLLSVGMLVDVRVLAGSAQAWKVMIGMMVTVVATKWLAARLAQRRFGYSAAEGWTMFGLSVPQAAATLAAALIGYRLELFDTTVLNGTIMMILATCTIGPWVVERYGRQVALQEEEKPYDPHEAPERILIPMTDPDRAEALLDLALLIRDPASPEPLLPLTVTPGDGRGSAGRIAEAEKMLSRAVVYAAGAGAPVVPLTRLDRSLTGGIIRGMAESRTTAVVVAWEGSRGRRNPFGPLLEPLLERTRQTVLALCGAHPLNTTRRVVLVLPPQSRRGRGYHEALALVKTFASRLGAPILGVTIGENPDRYRDRIAEIRPQVATTLRTVGGWEELGGFLRTEAGVEDVVVVMSARRRTVAWHPELAALPNALSGTVPGNLVVLFPSEAEPAEVDRRRSSPLPRSLNAERVRFGLPSMRFEEAVGSILATHFSRDSDQLEEIRDGLIRNEAGYSTELVPGVVFPSTRAAGLHEPLMFLGISAEGIDVPNAKHPAHLLFLLVSPADQPNEHLHHLATIAAVVNDPENVRVLSACRSQSDLFDWFHARRWEPIAAD